MNTKTHDSAQNEWIFWLTNINVYYVVLAPVVGRFAAAKYACDNIVIKGRGSHTTIWIFKTCQMFSRFIHFKNVRVIWVFREYVDMWPFFESISVCAPRACFENPNQILFFLVFCFFIAKFHYGLGWVLCGWEQATFQKSLHVFGSALTTLSVKI